MAKKAKGDRSDPKTNKSLAIRTVLAKTPKAKGSEIVDAVKKEFGHDVSVNMVYMIKTKQNMKSNRRKPGGEKMALSNGAGPGSANEWVNAIRIGRELLNATGGVANATALLKALER